MKKEIDKNMKPYNGGEMMSIKQYCFINDISLSLIESRNLGSRVTKYSKLNNIEFYRMGAVGYYNIKSIKKIFKDKTKSKTKKG